MSSYGLKDTGLHKTGIRGIQDTRQIVDGKTNDIENNDKKGGSKVQTLNPLDLRPFCKLKFVRCGPGEKNQSALSFSVEAWRPDEVREHLFPNSEIEIFIDFCRFSKNFPNFQKILRGPV